MNKELEEVLCRIEIHKDYAGLTNGTCIVNKQDLETVLEELKRLQEKNKELYEKNKRQQGQNKIANEKILAQKGQLKVFNEKFIYKDKIREKIEEQEELKEKYLKMREYGQVDIRLYKIAILKELLEGK